MATGSVMRLYHSSDQTPQLYLVAMDPNIAGICREAQLP